MRRPKTQTLLQTPFNVELDANPKTGAFPLTVTFTGRITGYADSSALQWLLDFKDGQVEWGEPPAADTFTIKHTYTTPGIYQVSLGSNDGISEGFDYVTIEILEEGYSIPLIVGVGGPLIVTLLCWLTQTTRVTKEPRVP